MFDPVQARPLLSPQRFINRLSVDVHPPAVCVPATCYIFALLRTLCLLLYISQESHVKLRLSPGNRPVYTWEAC